MFGFGLRKAQRPELDRTYLVGADLNATHLSALALADNRQRELVLDAPHTTLPLYITLDKRKPEVGHAGYGQCRISPHTTCSNFLHLLGMPREWRGDRFSLTPDEALGLILQQARGAIATETDAVGLAIPSYLSVPQVRRLLEQVQQARWPLRGAVSAPLAIVAHRAQNLGISAKQPEATVLVIDADQYALTADLVSVSQQDVQVQAQTVLEGSSWLAWNEWMIRALADRSVRVCRRDPRDSAQAEQSLFLQLPEAYAAARSNTTVKLTIRADHWFQEMALPVKEFQDLAQPMVRRTIQQLKDFLLSADLPSPPQAVWLTDTAGRLPGLAEELYKHSPEQSRLFLLPPHARAEAAAALVPRWLTGRLAHVYLDAVIPHATILGASAFDTAPLPTGSKANRTALPHRAE